MEKRRSKYSVILFLVPIILLSCDHDVIYSDSRIIEKNTWNLMNELKFNIPVDDTITASNISFIIRTGSSYPFRNIWVFVSTTSPDGKTIGDTLQYELADEKGKWFGKGLGDINELILPYKSNVYFPVKGNYIFNIQHGMRDEDLKGVYDFGIRLTRTSK